MVRYNRDILLHTVRIGVAVVVILKFKAIRMLHNRRVYHVVVKLFCYFSFAFCDPIYKTNVKQAELWSLKMHLEVLYYLSDTSNLSSKMRPIYATY